MSKLKHDERQSMNIGNGDVNDLNIVCYVYACL